MDENLKQPDSIVQTNTIEGKLWITVFIEIFSYFRSMILIPMIFLFGTLSILVIFTLMSFVNPDFWLWLLLPFIKNIPNSIYLNPEQMGGILIRAWWIISFAFYIIQVIIEKIAHKKFYVGYFKKIGLQMLILTIAYSFLTISAYLGLGFFQHGGESAASGFIFFYFITLVITLISWMILAPLDGMIFAMNQIRLPEEMKQKPTVISLKKGGLIEKILIKLFKIKTPEVLQNNKNI